MNLQKIVSFLIVSALALSEAAPKVSKNPKRLVAVADFPEKGTNKLTKGYVFFTSPTGGDVKVHIDFTGLPKMGGPFYYHIHENLVNADFCEDAGGHFDPYHGLSQCPEQGDDAVCQVGDLSGKHGWVNTTCYQTEYTDPFLSLNVKDPAYVVGKSLVLHLADQTRIACANIKVATKEQYKEMFGMNPIEDFEERRSPQLTEPEVTTKQPQLTSKKPQESQTDSNGSSRASKNEPSGKAVTAPQMKAEVPNLQINGTAAGVPSSAQTAVLPALIWAAASGLVAFVALM